MSCPEAHLCPERLRATRNGHWRSTALQRAARCVLERLEGRTLFAWNMTMSLAETVGVSSSTVSGTTTLTANASGANLCWASVQNEFQAGNNVVVNSGTGGAEAGNI